ncbi:MAG: thioredoxin [Alphaproteobacteria bacterium]|jgi:thioredoxin 1|nr:MAG: thioredoxin [Alphaproteobacteria bacterium]
MTSPFITIVDEKNFEAEVLKSDKLVLIDFYADWCGPCKALAPTLEKFAEDNKDKVKVVKVNVDESPNLSAAFGIRSIPTLVTMKDNQALYGAVGNLPKEALEKLVDQSLQAANENNIAPSKPDSNKPAGPAAP